MTEAQAIRSHQQEARRMHLMWLMAQYRVSCRQVAELVDRKPHTVRCWRSGANPMPDHTLALIELGLQIRAGELRRVE